MRKCHKKTNCSIWLSGFWIVTDYDLEMSVYFQKVGHENKLSDAIDYV